MRNSVLVFSIVALGGVLIYMAGDVQSISFEVLINMLAAAAFFIGVFG